MQKRAARIVKQSYRVKKSWAALNSGYLLKSRDDTTASRTVVGLFLGTDCEYHDTGIKWKQLFSTPTVFLLV